MSDFRINGFEQIKAFYSWVFNNADKKVKSQHISLYLFLINQNNRNNWVEWFKCPYDLGMTGACITNKKTYYGCLSDLELWGLIEYQKGVNEWRSPLIKLAVLNSTSTDTATVPQGEPQVQPLLQPQHIPLPTPLPHPYNNLITNNLKPITDNIDLILKVLKNIDIVNKLFNSKSLLTILSKNSKKKILPPPTLNEYINFFVSIGLSPDVSEEAWHRHDSQDWISSTGEVIFNWESHARQVYFRKENKIVEEETNSVVIKTGD